MPAVLRIEIRPAGKGSPARYNTGSSGLWRSLVARFVWDEDVAGSNPVSPTNSPLPFGAGPCSRYHGPVLGMVAEACDVHFPPMIWSAAQ